MKSQEVRERFIELRSRGHSYAKISEQLQVSKPTLIKWNREYRRHIEALQDEEMEAMCERFRIARVHRVERFVKLIDLVEHQLDARDLSEVRTERLLREWIHLMQAVRTELEPQRVQVEGRTDFEEGMLRYVDIARQMFEPGSVELQDALAAASEAAPLLKLPKA